MTMTVMVLLSQRVEVTCTSTATVKLWPCSLSLEPSAKMVKCALLNLRRVQCVIKNTEFQLRRSTTSTVALQQAQRLGHST